MQDGQKVGRVQWSGRLGLLLYATGAGLLAWGQWALLKGQVDLGLARSGAGIAAAFLGLALRELPWAAWLAAFKELRRERAEQAAARRLQATRSSGPVPVRRGASAAAALPMVPPRGPWSPFSSEELSLSRNWLWVPMALLLAMVQWSLMRSSITSGSILIILFVLFLAVYLQGLGSPIVIPHLNANARALRGLLMGLPFQLFGTWLLWGYKYIWTGFTLTAVGSLLMLWSLARHPFKLSAGAGDSPPPDPGYVPPRPWNEGSRLQVKAALVFGAILCGWLAVNVFGVNRQGAALTATFIGILLLMGSFPWLPGGLAGWEGLPVRMRGWASAGLAVLALLLGFRGQRLIDGGSLNPGLWHFVAGAAILALVLERRRDAAQDLGAAEPAWWAKAEVWGLAVFVLLAFQMRMWKIDIFPWGAEGDEAGGHYFYSWQILRGNVENYMVTENVPLHFFSITALFFKFFGLSVGVMRWHAVIFGTLSVVALYFLLRLYFGRWISLMASALMAMGHWHLHYSRFAHYNAEQLFCQTVAFYFIFKAFRTEKLWQWAVGGLAFGLAMLPNLASRVLPFIGIALLLYFFVAWRDLLRRHMGGFLAFIVASWMVASPCLTYWARAIPLSMGRAKSVSIFDKTNTNAPVDTLAGFITNCKMNMLMFNHIGDSRHRNNPLPNHKMLESMTAALFALAFLYALYHWRDSFMFVLIVGFMINMAASVFSVEAPQSHRTAGNIPILYSMIAFMLFDIRRSFKAAMPRLGGTVFLVLAVPLLGVASYRAAKSYFVDARGLAFDVSPTYVAMKVGHEGTPDDYGIFWASGYASSHPPVLLFKKDVPLRNFYNITDWFPVSQETHRRHLMLLSDDYQDFLPYVRSLYPESKVEAIPDIQGGRDVAKYIEITPAQIAAIQGLEASDLGGGTVLPAADLAWPQPGLEKAKDLRFKGALRFQYFGFYRLHVGGRGDCRLVINGQTAFSRSGGVERVTEVRLPRGLSSVQLSYAPKGAGDSFKVRYEGRPHPNRQLYSLQSGEAGEITRNMTFHVPVQGLYGLYYANSSFSGDPVMEYQEPSVMAHWLDSPLVGAWSTVWRGKLRVPEAGSYPIRLQTNGGYSEVRVNGRLVSRYGNPLDPSRLSVRLDPLPQLSKGVHDIEVRFATAGQSWIDLRWTRPGRAEELVLPEFLTPTYPER